MERGAGLIVQGWVIIEVKVVQARDSAHVAKCLNCIARHETGDLPLGRLRQGKNPGTALDYESVDRNRDCELGDS